MVDIANPDLFVCGCQTWICLDITLFMRSSASHPAGQHGRCAQKTGKLGPPLLGVGGFDTICTAVCNHCDSSTACRLCRLESSLIYLRVCTQVPTVYTHYDMENTFYLELTRFTITDSRRIICTQCYSWIINMILLYIKGKLLLYTPLIDTFLIINNT